MKNRLRDLLTAGKPAIGAQLRFGSPAIAEMFAHAGYDWLIIDSEHAPQTPPGIQAQLQAIGNTTTTPIVRLPKVDEEQIRLYLDMGALGIAAAMVNTPEEAEFGARACRYPPDGIRGWGPHRAYQYGFDEKAYLRDINDQVMFIPLIETVTAVENIDDILAVPGVDSFLIGPADLTFSLGIPLDYQNPLYLDAQAKVLDAARRAGKPAGGGVMGPANEPAPLREAIDQGYRALLLGGDEFLLTGACRSVIDNAREVSQHISPG